MRKLCKWLKTNLILVIAIIGILYFITSLFGNGNGGTKDKSKVWVLAKHSVETKLKSPSSAKFPSKSKADISEMNGKYVVKSYVDADNSFGSSIRSKFTVTLIKNSSGDYIVESVDIN